VESQWREIELGVVGCPPPSAIAWALVQSACRRPRSSGSRDDRRCLYRRQCSGGGQAQRTASGPSSPIKSRKAASGSTRGGF